MARTKKVSAKAKSDTLKEIEKQQLRLLVHAYLYYDTAETIIDDVTYDKFANKLAELIESNEAEAKKSVYYADFKNFKKGCTSGFNFGMRRNNEVVFLAESLVKYKKEKGL